MDKILPKPTKISAPFWEACRNGRLTIQRCADCGTYVYYPAYMCPRCTSSELAWTEVSGRGSVYSCTVVERPATPAYKDDVPLAVALIELDEGPVMMSNVVNVDPHAVRIGDRVQVAFKRMSPDVTLPVFEPAQA